MIAYKLFRQLKNGNITSLFINKSVPLPCDVWMGAENCPTKGFAIRPFWHCMSIPEAPHLSLKNRVWYKVEMGEYTEFKRHPSQGKVWYLASAIKIIKEVKV